jgi:hypothetical protein
MTKYLIAAGLLAVASSALAEVRFYGEYRNEVGFVDEHYVDNSSINTVSLGAQGKYLYAEVGPAFYDGEYGLALEAGYSIPFADNWEIRGEVETFQLDSFEGEIGSRVETEIRRYF